MIVSLQRVVDNMLSVCTCYYTQSKLTCRPIPHFILHGSSHVTQQMFSLGGEEHKIQCSNDSLHAWMCCSMGKCTEVRVPGVQHEGNEVPVHHDDGVPGVQHDEAPLGARPLRVEGDQQVGGKALIVVNGMHTAQSNLHGDQVVCL